MAQRQQFRRQALLAPGRLVTCLLLRLTQQVPTLASCLRRYLGRLLLSHARRVLPGIDTGLPQVGRLGLHDIRRGLLSGPRRRWNVVARRMSGRVNLCHRSHLQSVGTGSRLLAARPATRDNSGKPAI